MIAMHALYLPFSATVHSDNTRLLPIIIKHQAQHDTDISISPENVPVILHGRSASPISESDWLLENELEPFLA